MSRKLTLTLALTAICTLCFAPDGMAQKKKGKGKGDPKARIAMLFKRMDTNKDGKLNKDDSSWAKISKLDTDKNGEVSLKELAIGMKRRLGKKGPRGNPVAWIEGMFKKLDVDKDGAITKEEAKRLWARLQWADTNTDGKVTKKELAEAIKKRMKGKKGQKRRKGPGKKRGGKKTL